MSRFVYYFFSSRRRHTRCGRDWSSDVCSSDLGCLIFEELTDTQLLRIGAVRVVQLEHRLKLLGFGKQGYLREPMRGTRRNDLQQIPEMAEQADNAGAIIEISAVFQHSPQYVVGFPHIQQQVISGRGYFQLGNAQRKKRQRQLCPRGILHAEEDLK